MKIDSIQRSNMINAYSKQRQPVKSQATNKVQQDKVTISEDAKYLNKVNSDNDNVDLDKVNEIKNRIKQGTYSVNSRKVAEKILEAMKGE